MKKYKRKRKRHYITGIHVSKKCEKPISYRSGWELRVAKIFDQDPEVLCYSYESVGIPYRSNMRTLKIRRYFPDFFVSYTSGKRVIIEVKRDDRINSPKTIKKAEACIEWASKSGVQYEIWGLKKIQEEEKRVEQMKTALQTL